MKLAQIIGDYTTFLQRMLRELKEAGFDTADFVQLDHLCYRTVSHENYEIKKVELASLATLLGETEVNGRPIATFRLNDPIIHDRWRIDALELPAPKQDNQYPEGLEHVEFVIYDELTGFVDKYPHKAFDMKSASRGINPEVGFSLGQHAVKFHLLSLTTVLYLEHKLGINKVS